MSAFDEPVQFLDDTVVDWFGDAAIYMPLAAASFAIVAIFSSPAVREESAQQASFHDAFVRFSDFSGQDPPRPGDAMRVGSLTYRVFDVRADWGRGYKLSLQRS